MKILFFGLGSIGKRHAKLLLEHFEHELFAFRSGEGQAPNDLGIKEIKELSQIDALGIDVAFITNPTFKHMEYATYCAERGIDLFIEKPLAADQKSADEFARIAKKKGISVYVAYCLRFHPVIAWLKDHTKTQKPFHVSVYSSSYLPNWRKGQNHLEGYSAHKAMGGGALLDLSHEVDYLVYLFGKPSKMLAVGGRAGEVTVDADDFLDAILTFGKTSCNLHIDFFSQNERRDIILDFPDHSVVADLLANMVQIKKNGKMETIKFESEKNGMYLEQLKYFFNNLGKKGQMNDLNEALEVFGVLMRLRKEAES